MGWDIVVDWKISMCVGASSLARLVGTTQARARRYGESHHHQKDLFRYVETHENEMFTQNNDSYSCSHQARHGRVLFLPNATSLCTHLSSTLSLSICASFPSINHIHFIMQRYKTTPATPIAAPTINAISAEYHVEGTAAPLCSVAPSVS